MEETLAILATIKGGSSLFEWLTYDGGYYDFGDDEVAEIVLDRVHGSRLVIISMKVIDGEWAARRVTFHLSDMIDANISGFVHQNVIGGLHVRKLGDYPAHPSLLGIGGISADHEIKLEPCAGAFGLIRATITEIRVELWEVE